MGTWPPLRGVLLIENIVFKVNIQNVNFEIRWKAPMFTCHILFVCHRRSIEQNGLFCWPFNKVLLKVDYLVGWYRQLERKSSYRCCSLDVSLSEEEECALWYILRAVNLRRALVFTSVSHMQCLQELQVIRWRRRCHCSLRPAQTRARFTPEQRPWATGSLGCQALDSDSSELQPFL